MMGAHALIQSLSEAGVEVCFANPGTSEMQLVAALDDHPRMRAILGLFEGVVTGAADGYGRMADKPALTLLHLGPGLTNGAANLHNARRARSPVVNLVGDHAVDHLQYDAPLISDVLGLARPVSDWVDVSTSPTDLAAKGVAAVAAALAYPGQVATLVAPADHTWDDGSQPAAPLTPATPVKVPDAALDVVLDAAKCGDRLVLLLGGRALREEALEQAGRVAAATGARLLCETFPARLQRGVGRVPVERLPYFGEAAEALLGQFDTVVLVAAAAPVAFFAYPGKPSGLVPAATKVLTLAKPAEDSLDALRRLAEALRAPADPPRQSPVEPAVATDRLTPAAIGAVLASLLPEDAIVSDEAATASVAIFDQLAGAAPHDWITLTGGAIGQGLPLALGAAVACPDRKVVALQADGSAMYTVQALWTMAREGSDVTIVVINNGAYAILMHELQRVGVKTPGPKAVALLDLTRPVIDWVSLAESMGVPAIRASTVDALRATLVTALSTRGPYLIEAWMPLFAGGER